MAFNVSRNEHVVQTTPSSCDVFHFICNTLVIGALCLLGLVGNTLSFLVHQRDRNHQVPALLLKALAVADNCVLLVALFVFSIVSGLDSNVTRVHWFDGRLPFIIKYVQPIGYMTQTATIWVTVLLAFNRFVAVCRPFHLSKNCSLNTVRLQLAVVFTLAVALNVPRVFQYDVERRVIITTNSSTSDVNTPSATSRQPESHNSDSGSPWSDGSESTNVLVTSVAYVHVPTAIGEHTLFGVVYTNALYSFLVLLLPLVIIAVLNVRIIREVRNRAVLPSSGRGGDSRALENNITFVMLVIVFEFLISHTPDRVWQVFKMAADYKMHRCSPAYYVHNLCNLLIVLNSSTNFIVYYFFALRFRKVLLAKLCRRKLASPQQPRGDELLMIRLRVVKTSASMQIPPLTYLHMRKSRPISDMGSQRIHTV